MSAEDYASLALWNAALIQLGVVATVIARGKARTFWFLIAIALFNLNVGLVLDFAGVGGVILKALGSPALEFNWTGKLLALTATLVLIAVLPGIDRADVGLTLRQSPSAWIGWSVLAVLVAINAYVAIALLDNPRHAAEAIAYQLTLPSLDEELFYRGLFLLALCRAFGDGPRILWAPMGWGALITSVMFGLIHALYWTADGLSFSPTAFAITGSIGLLLVWLRLNTGSLLAPILLHSAINTMWRVF